MLDASALHDALRAEGLVPPEEDVHLLSCSNRWHGALQRIDAELFGDDDPSQLREDLEDALDSAQEAERQADALTRNVTELEAKLDCALLDLSNAQGERDRALERVVELEAELAKLRAAE